MNRRDARELLLIALAEALEKALGEDALEESRAYAVLLKDVIVNGEESPLHQFEGEIHSE